MTKEIARTKSDISYHIKRDERYVIGAVITLASIHKQNGGLGSDRDIIIGLSKQYLQRGYLTGDQLRLLRPRLKKYYDQLEQFGGISPVENKIPGPPKKTKAGPGATKHVSFYDKKKTFLKVKFDYDTDLNRKVKTIDKNRQFKKEDGEKFWVMPALIDNIEQLENLGFSFSDEVQEWVDERDMVEELDEIGEIPNFDGTLRPFQSKGVSYIESRRGRALIADEMGLGKTPQAWAWCLLHDELRPILIVCPASAKYTWEREIHKFTSDPPSLEVVEGTTLYEFEADVTIINYDILHHWLEYLLEKKYKIAVLDEAHKIKNSKTKRTKATKELVRRTPALIALTGTPIENKPLEIFNVSNLIKPGVFPSAKRFEREYDTTSTGAKNTAKLHRILVKEFMLRRKKKDVLQELPEKSYFVTPIKLSNVRKYAEIETDFINYVRKVDPSKVHKAVRAKALTKINYLRAALIEGKLNPACTWIEEMLEVENKLVVFCERKMAVNKLMEKFAGRAVKIDGSTTMKNRQKAIDHFQNDPSTELFVGNMKAAAENITLTAANNVAFIELPWNPSVMDQCSDRIHRIGQEAESVNVYCLIARNTIENGWMELLDKKRKVASEIVDGEAPSAESMLVELMKMVQKKYPEGVV